MPPMATCGGSYDLPRTSCTGEFSWTGRYVGWKQLSDDASTAAPVTTSRDSGGGCRSVSSSSVLCPPRAGAELLPAPPAATAAYLANVEALMDGLLFEVLREQPPDPAAFLIQKLELQQERQERQQRQQRQQSERQELLLPPPPPPLPAPLKSPALLQGLPEAPPLPKSAAATTHRFGATVPSKSSTLPESDVESTAFPKSSVHLLHSAENLLRPAPGGSAEGRTARAGVGDRPPIAGDAPTPLPLRPGTALRRVSCVGEVAAVGASQGLDAGGRTARARRRSTLHTADGGRHAFLEFPQLRGAAAAGGAAGGVAGGVAGGLAIGTAVDDSDDERSLLSDEDEDAADYADLPDVLVAEFPEHFFAGRRGAVSAGGRAGGAVAGASKASKVGSAASGSAASGSAVSAASGSAVSAASASAGNGSAVSAVSAAAPPAVIRALSNCALFKHLSSGDVSQLVAALERQFLPRGARLAGLEQLLVLEAGAVDAVATRGPPPPAPPAAPADPFALPPAAFPRGAAGGGSSGERSGRVGVSAARGGGSPSPERDGGFAIAGTRPWSHSRALRPPQPPSHGGLRRRAASALGPENGPGECERSLQGGGEAGDERAGEGAGGAAALARRYEAAASGARSAAVGSFAAVLGGCRAGSAPCGATVSRSSSLLDGRGGTGSGGSSSCDFPFSLPGASLSRALFSLSKSLDFVERQSPERQSSAAAGSAAGLGSPDSSPLLLPAVASPSRSGSRSSLNSAWRQLRRRVSQRGPKGESASRPPNTAASFLDALPAAVPVEKYGPGEIVGVLEFLCPAQRRRNAVAAAAGAAGAAADPAPDALALEYVAREDCVFWAIGAAALRARLAALAEARAARLSAALAATPFFAALPPQTLRALADVAEEKVFQEERIVEPQGAPCRMLHVVTAGEVRELRSYFSAACLRSPDRPSKTVAIRVLRAGDWFGDETFTAAAAAEVQSAATGESAASEDTSTYFSPRYPSTYAAAPSCAAEARLVSVRGFAVQRLLGSVADLLV